VVDLDGEGGEAWRRPALSCGSGGREKRRERFKKKEGLTIIVWIVELSLGTRV
jgi:hypothetical protein